MPQANRICKTCGKQYYFCTNCNKTLNSPQWMLMWHDENCKKVFEIVSDYAQKHITKADAKKRLETCNMRVFYTFNEKIRTYIEEITAEDTVVEPVEEVEEELPVRSISSKRTRSQRNRRK